jgi:hypothetical protein
MKSTLRLLGDNALPLVGNSPYIEAETFFALAGRGGCLFCRKTTLSMIALSRRRLNNEEALDADSEKRWVVCFLIDTQ